MLAWIAILLAFQTAGGAPAAFETLSRQAAAARDAGRLEEALALYRKGLALNPKWTEGLWNYGSIAYDRNKYSDCAPVFRQLVAIKPDDPAAWTMSGLCEYGLRDYSAALRSLLETERLKFAEPGELARAARLHLAMLLTRAGWFERAIVLINMAPSQDRTTPQFVAACGIAGLRKPWLPLEVPASERDKVFRLGDAMTEAMRVDPKEAIAKFEAATRDYPDEPNIHFRFGAFLLRESPDRGIGEMKRALELDAAHVPSMVGLSTIYLKRGETKDALRYGEAAVKTAADDFTARMAYGRALLASDAAAAAERELEAAVKLVPTSPEARFNLASAYSRLGRKADAARELQEFKRLKKLVDSSQP